MLSDRKFGKPQFPEVPLARACEGVYQRSDSSTGRCAPHARVRGGPHVYPPRGTHPRRRPSRVRVRCDMGLTG